MSEHPPQNSEIGLTLENIVNKEQGNRLLFALRQDEELYRGALSDAIKAHKQTSRASEIAPTLWQREIFGIQEKLGRLDILIGNIEDKMKRLPEGE